MADYYPLLARALEALPDRSPPMRKAVYDRARSALIGQLRSLDPPLSEADIGLESRALDTAIARLEVDFGGPPPAEAPTAPAPSPPIASPPPAPPPPEPSIVPDTERPDATPPEPAHSPEAPSPEPAEPIAAPAAEPESRADFVPFVPPRKAKIGPKPPANEDASPAPVAPTAAVAAGPSVEPDAANGRRRPRIDVVPPKTGRSRLLRNAFVGAMLALVIGLIAVAAFMLRDQPADLDTNAGSSQEALSEPPESKFADRIGGERAPTERRPAGQKPNTGPSDVTVTQQAVLIEENTADPKAAPTTTTGRAIWRLDAVNGEQGQPLQNAVRANVEFPEAGFSLTMTIRKNLDPTLPASHTIDLLFNDTASGEKRIVQEIGLLQLKDEENARGSPVSGLPVRVRDNFFLIGLSNLPNEVERNTELLTNKAWLDLPVKFKSGARGVLTFNAGGSGSQVIQSAFDQWRE